MVLCVTGESQVRELISEAGSESRRESDSHGDLLSGSPLRQYSPRIDFSDMPELSDKQLKRMKRVGRPADGMAKQLITIRLLPRLLSAVRNRAAKLRRFCQTLTHEVLERWIFERCDSDGAGCGRIS